MLTKLLLTQYFSLKNIAKTFFTCFLLCHHDNHECVCWNSKVRQGLGVCWNKKHLLKTKSAKLIITIVSDVWERALSFWNWIFSLPEKTRKKATLYTCPEIHQRFDVFLIYKNSCDYFCFWDSLKNFFKVLKTRCVISVIELMKKSSISPLSSIIWIELWLKCVQSSLEGKNEKFTYIP